LRYTGAVSFKLGQAPHLLFVDDHEDTRVVMSLLLGSDGYQVDVAGDAAQARDLAAAAAYDLYILDVQLPGSDGIQLCEELKKMTPDVPVLFCSALNQEDLRERALNSGGAEYLLKPVRVEILEAAIENCLGPAH
jgi:DNA-binding response OmpR family regulator